MFSRGAIGGAPIDAFALNGGSFVEEVSATGSLSTAGAAELHRRLPFSAASVIALNGIMTSRVSVRAASTILVAGIADPIRRAAVLATDNVGVHGVMDGRRRTAMLGSSAVGVIGRAVLIHRVLRRAPEIRTITQLPDSRVVGVSADMRCQRVPRDRRTMIVEPDRRAA